MHASELQVRSQWQPQSSGLTMFPQLEASMLLKHIQIKLFCPAHDRHWEALQTWDCTILQKHQQSASVSTPDRHREPSFASLAIAVTGPCNHSSRYLYTSHCKQPFYIIRPPRFVLAFMIRVVKIVSASTTTVPPPVNRFITPRSLLRACPTLINSSTFL